MKEIVEALNWYQERAEALNRYSKEKKWDAIMAVITELSLDNGNRAKAAVLAI